MTTTANNIVLIGMPGSGKSTVGVLLSKILARSFVDTDILIQTSQGRPLQEIVDTQGHMALRGIEEAVVLGLACSHHVIATGGSVPYSAKAMAHLKQHGVVVFLHVDLATLLARVADYGTRGLAKRPDQGIEDLFSERLPLYRHYADITVDCIGLNHDAVCLRIVEELARP